MIPFSVLDLSPVPEGSTAGDALRNTRELARLAEKLGYRRYWLAEHHNMPGIASAATAVAIGYVAEATSTIRVGSGGIMLPNHAPLVVAEQFGTLESLYPGRIDLGVGRSGQARQPTISLALGRGWCIRTPRGSVRARVLRYATLLDDIPAVAARWGEIAPLSFAERITRCR